MPSILQSGEKAVIDQVKAEKPSQFRVGATADILNRKAEVIASYDRTWSNLWGFTAYAKAYWNDQAVIPADKFGAVIGADVSKKF